MTYLVITNARIYQYIVAACAHNPTVDTGSKSIDVRKVKIWNKPITLCVEHPLFNGWKHPIWYETGSEIVLHPVNSDIAIKE